MADRLLTEDGDYIVSETAPGVTGASSLNDTLVEAITSETFETDPLASGWLIGDGWEWDAVALNMKVV